MINANEFIATDDQGNRWKVEPVPLEPEVRPFFSYVGLQAGGPGTAVTRLSENFSSMVAAFDKRDELRPQHPGAEVFFVDVDA